MKTAALERALGYEFRDRSLLEQALTHRSYGQPNNERLEFLGDGILNCVIAMALFSRFTEMREGDMSRLRAGLVRQEALHALGLGLDLGACLHLGEGELKGGGASRPSILADALEAIFAAVQLDGGFDAARGVIERLYQTRLEAINPAAALKDAKTALQELLQSRRHALPQYTVLGISGEAHAQAFEVECFVPSARLRTRGQGASRRIAEQQAAQAALEALRK